MHSKFGLERLLGSSYAVFSYWKAGATTRDLIGNNTNEISRLTNNDYVILLTGINDKNPREFILELNLFLTSVSNTNVIISEIPYNKYLNESKLNYELKFICNNYSNVLYMNMNYSSFLPHYQYFNINLSRTLLKEILHITYKNSYAAYANKSLCKRYSNVGTQTDICTSIMSSGHLDKSLVCDKENDTGENTIGNFFR